MPPRVQIQRVFPENEENSQFFLDVKVPIVEFEFTQTDLATLYSAYYDNYCGGQYEYEAPPAREKERKLLCVFVCAHACVYVFV